MDVTKLSLLAEQAKSRSIYSLFTDKQRAQKYSLSVADLFLDYSKQNIIDDELSTVISLAVESGLSDKIKAQFSGEKINKTEKRAVLHTLLRAPDKVKRTILPDYADEVINTEKQMAKIVDDVYSGNIKSITGERFTDVLAIGIGGSFYGVKVGLTALRPFHCLALDVHFLANVDGAAVKEKLEKLVPQTTLVVVISKTFSTQETLLNATAVKNWMLASLPRESIAQQWFAVSTNIKQVKLFGLSEEHILPMWDWVGWR
jgi:glucose-6-phosphate isomerase